MLLWTVIVALSAALLVLSRMSRRRRAGVEPAGLEPLSPLNVHRSSKQSRNVRSALHAATGLLH
jgi:hypothetical protein